MTFPWNGASAAAIGIDWLLEALAPAGDFGRRAHAQARVFVPGEESEALASIVAVDRMARAFAPAHLGALAALLAAAPDPSMLLARARAGDVLDDVDFFELLRFLDTVSGARTALGGFDGFDLAGDGEALRLALAPGRTPQRTFYLDSAFDSELAAARDEAAARQAAYDAARSGIVERVVRALGVEHVREGEFVVMRERLTGSVPPEIHVVRETPTYLLCELALDEAALAALARCDAADTRVADLEERVRIRLSNSVRDGAVQLDALCRSLGELDVLTARARFARQYDAIVPEIVAHSSLSFNEARYLPLVEALAAHGRPYEPVSLDLDGVGVITGPNMSGKSAALRTCGFLAACVALGLPVPARSARIPLFDDIAWLGSATPHEIEGQGERGLLSAFGAEVVELRAFFERNARRPLALIDEFARTTSPREGRALLIALLERLSAHGACGLASTHLSNIASDAGVTHYAVAGLRDLPRLAEGAVELETALAQIAQAMDYGIAGVDERTSPRADALALAEILGLDSELIARAREVL
jgi:DNA mismatch repair protein MutS2